HVRCRRVGSDVGPGPPRSAGASRRAATRSGLGMGTGLDRDPRVGAGLPAEHGPHHGRHARRRRARAAAPRRHHGAAAGARSPARGDHRAGARLDLGRGPLATAAPRRRELTRPGVPGDNPFRPMRRDLRATGLLSVAILGSRILGLAREVVFAALFGARAVADAYQVAFRIPNLLRDLLAEGALSSAFVPTFRDTLTREGSEAAWRLANLVVGALLVLTGALTMLGMVFSTEIVTLIAGGFGGDAAKVELTSRLTRLMMPILAL